MLICLWEEYEKRLAELAELAGLLPEYYDIFGNRHVVSRETKAAILSEMGFPAGTRDDANRGHYRDVVTEMDYIVQYSATRTLSPVCFK